jgi:putative ABC transport system substrate-binding protein
MRKTETFIFVSFICLILTLVLALPVTGIGAEKEVYKICMTQIVTHPALDESRRGFVEGMAQQGFKEGVNVDYVFRNAQGDMHVAASIAKYFVSIKPDLIAAFSTPCSQAVVAAAKGTDIPIVFMLVTDPVTSGLVPSWTKSAPYVTGVSNWSDVPAQIRYILEIMPGVKKLGILYNAGEVNSVVQRDRLVNEVAPELGLKVVEATAATTSDVYAAAKSLVGRVDAMWMPTDSTVFSAVDSVLKVAEENDIPFFGADELQAKAGLAAAAGVDIYAVGSEGSVMAGKILRGEATPGDLPPIKPKKMMYAVNPDAAKRMGLAIPQAIIDKAGKVYK